MRHILASRNLLALEKFARSNVVVAFDYDGTLAPISRDPAAARPRATTERLLIEVSRRYPCIVLSGRRHADLTTRLRRVPVRGIVGNHGLEPSVEGARYARHVREWLRHLSEQLPARPGLTVEGKTYSVAIHYRRVASKRRVLAEIEAAVKDLRGVRNLGGNQAVNLVPVGAPHKGTALQRAVRELGCERAIFVGDEPTDEDAFRSGTPDRLLSVRIGLRRSSAAGYYLKNQAEIDPFLRRLLEIRRP